MNRLSAGLLAAGLLAAVAPAASAQAPQVQFINEQIAAGWKAADIKKTAARASDHEFLRRAFIDLIGRVATPEEVTDFEQDVNRDKRSKLVHRLLYESAYKPKVGGAPVTRMVDGKKETVTFDYAGEYAEHWANMWTVWLTSRSVDARYRDQMRVWLQQEFLKNTSHKEIVTQLLTAKGKTNQNGAVNFLIHHLGDQNPPAKQAELGKFDSVPVTSRVTRLFLGLQTQCTQCHDHPFNKEWVQADFWGVNAYFRQVVRVGTPTDRTMNNQMGMALTVVELTDASDLNPSNIIYYERRDGKMMASKPNFLKDLAQADKGETANKKADAFPGKTRREAMAEYVVTHDNFARAYVNRVWGHLFGRGLNKEPAVDDFGSHNEVVHPELLNKLATDFAQYGYDPKKLLEWVCNSDAYSLSHVAPDKATGDPKNDPYFARMPLKALSPEVLFESLMTATKTELLRNSDDLKKLREDWMAKLVRNFGDDEGNEMTFNGTVVQALLMMNGREMNSAVAAKGANAVQKVVEKHSRGGATNADAVLDDLFIMALNRRPASDERAKIKAVMQRGAILKAEPAKKEPTSGAAAPAKPAPGAKPAPKNPKKDAPAAPGIVMPTSATDVTFYQDVFWALLNTNEFMLNH
jgi:hypothetical protein